MLNYTNIGARLCRISWFIISQFAFGFVTNRIRATPSVMQVWDFAPVTNPKCIHDASLMGVWSSFILIIIGFSSYEEYILHSVISTSLISRNPREWMFLVQISLLIVTLLSLVSRFFCHWSKPSKKSIHTLALRRVLICGVSSSSSSSWMLVHAYATSSRKAKWSGPHQRRWEENELKFHSVTCYSKCIVSRIHVNTTKLRNITCALVGTRVI